ncbi:hypothetical protein, partial [Clostridium perfringens]|uniref:hypothetical protein n=1 Tax=Clostridium perfringens TaxID=1502 RepID=UPI0039ECF238
SYILSHINYIIKLTKVKIFVYFLNIEILNQVNTKIIVIVSSLKRILRIKISKKHNKYWT